MKNSSSYKILNEITIFFFRFSFFEIDIGKRYRAQVRIYVGSPGSKHKKRFDTCFHPIFIQCCFCQADFFSPNIDRQREKKESAQKEEKKIRWPCTSYINVYYTYLVTVWMKFMYQAWNTSGYNNNKKKMCDAKRA